LYASLQNFVDAKRYLIYVVLYCQICVPIYGIYLLFQAAVDEKAKVLVAKAEEGLAIGRIGMVTLVELDMTGKE
jgi:hypothetical protein